MTYAPSDRQFTGSIPEIYETCLVPLLFEPYAADLAGRLLSRPVSRVLELAAGTGVVSRAIAARMPATMSLVATDLNQAMLDRAAAGAPVRGVEWRQADAMQLPFDNEAFDAVVCQFGVMFFPDKVRAFSEVRRVLKPGGVFIFNVWDPLAENAIPDTIQRAVAGMFPDDPPRFLERTPYAYNDRAVIASDLAKGGFSSPATFEVVPARSRAESARVPAKGFCEGTPLRGEIEARDPARLAEATDRAAAAIAERFGPGAVDGRIQALVAVVERQGAGSAR